jgi:hypothetical protein
VGDPAAEEVAEGVGVHVGELAQAEMEMATGTGLAVVGLGHEGDADAALFGDLFEALFEQDVVVGHRQDVGVADVDFVLARPHSPLEFSTGMPERRRWRRTAAVKNSSRLPWRRL